MRKVIAAGQTGVIVEGDGCTVPLLPLKTYIEVNETMASLGMPSHLIGIAMNS